MNVVRQTFALEKLIQEQTRVLESIESHVAGMEAKIADLYRDVALLSRMIEERDA